MKTIIEDKYLDSLDEASPLEGNLPKPTQNDPLGKEDIPTTQNTSKTEVDKTTEKETSETTKETKPEADSSPTQKKEVKITHQSAPDVNKEEEDAGLSNTVTDILKIYELKKIHEKVSNLKNVISKFSAVELDSVKNDIEESLYLFRKVLIPNLDNLQFKLDDIIKGYQGLIKDVIFKLKTYSISQKRKQENDTKRRKK